ncbi:hypothetical protein [Flectobacillus longus]|uniref:hypothetical protein n=1 Tax=Flectobacillus longus TaxID=2984207 RepID=UPI0024B825EE|nr:hypothetical protein [Flectobacillus longus]MDI9880252.1 hypothetical protein [Flectobacillus longus]
MTTQQKFNSWLDTILTNEKPEKDIIGYYFGLVTTEEGYQAYLIGSKTFDESTDDWACNIDFSPVNKYLFLGQKDLAWYQILDNFKTYLIDYSKTSVFKNSFLENSIAIAYGFDEGDLFRLK